MPIPIRVFVERVRPCELFSARVLAIPGVEKRVTYQVESTVCGTYVSYSVTLRGWLSPLIWWMIRSSSARVAAELASAAEQVSLQAQGWNKGSGELSIPNLKFKIRTEQLYSAIAHSQPLRCFIVGESAPVIACQLQVG